MTDKKNYLKSKLLTFRPGKILYIKKHEKEKLDEWISYLKSNEENKKRFLFYLKSSDTKLMEEIALYITHQLDYSLQAINLSPLKTSHDLDEMFDEFMKSSEEKKCLLYFYNFEVLLSNEKEMKIIRENLLEKIFENHPVAFLVSSLPTKPLLNSEDDYWIDFDFAPPNESLRQKIWMDLLGENTSLLRKITVEQLTRIYKLSKTQICQAHSYTVNRCKPYSKEKKANLFEDILIESCITQNSEMLSKLAVKIDSKETLGDVVLPSDQLQNINEIIMFARQEKKAHELSGLGNRSYGKGINILFTGVSGTGKTLTALVIGNELGLPVYKIDLSA